MIHDKFCTLNQHFFSSNSNALTCKNGKSHKLLIARMYVALVISSLDPSSHDPIDSVSQLSVNYLINLCNSNSKSISMAKRNLTIPHSTLPGLAIVRFLLFILPRALIRHPWFKSNPNPPLYKIMTIRHYSIHPTSFRPLHRDL